MSGTLTFLNVDVTSDDLPEADVVLCRDCLVHLSSTDIFAALRNFRRSGSTYLLTTTYPGLLSHNRNIVTGMWRPVDLQLPPFGFPAPFKAHLAAQGTVLPGYVEREFEDYLECGRLEHGFLRVRCEYCHAEHLVAFSCKRRGFCPSCGARRMAESAALLVDEVFPEQPVRQWVLSFPVSLALPVRQPPDDHGTGAGHRLPRHCHASDQEGRLQPQDGPHRRGHADPALWLCAEPQYPLPHAVPRRGVCRAPRRLTPIPLGEGADERRARRG